MRIRGNSIDPRVKRTRQLLIQAFKALLQEKDPKDISVQDITDRATVNRATFYAHFEDKYDLMDSLMREEFQRVLTNSLPTSSSLSTSSLQILILTVFNFLGDLHHRCQPTDRRFDPLFEAALQQQLAEILLNWLKQLPPTEQQRLQPLETTALVISWAIFGPAVQWSHSRRMRSAGEMARYVTQIVVKGLADTIASLPSRSNPL